LTYLYLLPKVCEICAVRKSPKKPVDLELGHNGMIKEKVKNTFSERKAGGKP
jgi:hypothetical protein